MHCEIVHRAGDGFAAAQGLNLFYHQIGVKGVRVVVVQLAPLFIGQLVMALVVIVMADDRDILPKTLFQFSRQGGLPGTRAPRNADDDAVHANSLLSALVRCFFQYSKKAGQKKPFWSKKCPAKRRVGVRKHCL